MTYLQEETTDLFTGKKSVDEAWYCDNPECKKRIWPSVKHKTGTHFCDELCFREFKGQYNDLMFRYYAIFTGEKPTIKWDIYKVVRKTSDKYCWIDCHGKARLVRTHGPNRYCWPSRAQAKHHFMLRMRWQYQKSQRIVKGCKLMAIEDDDWHELVCCRKSKLLEILEK